MGVYLSSPVTEKESVNEECPDQGFCYGASSMQGWRITQEDAHNCIPIFDDQTRTSFFAVYDGHGGSEVAKYCELHLPDFVKSMMEKSSQWQEDKAMATQFIQSAFLAFDATLTTEEVIKELKSLAGKEDDNEDEDEDDPVGGRETDLLREEAEMPLEQVLAQYGTEAEARADKSKEEPSSSGTSSKLENGPAAASSSKDACASASSDKVVSASASSSSSSSSVSASSSSTAAPSSSSVNKTEPVGSTNGDNTEAKVNGSDINNSAHCSQPAAADATSSAGKSKSSDTNQSGSSGSKESPFGPKSSKGKSEVLAEFAATADDSDDEDDEDDEMWEDMSDEDDDDEDDEEDDVDQGKDVPTMDTTDEEPGSDSGCTACVLLKHGKSLVVANAGDSRCVLARAGQAVDLSFDHKPEDEPELTRIENAGGQVTADGRVNGGLNLSRAIGDHVYKRNEEVSAKDQMITALPDVHIEQLCENDQFIVIACDGIWNSMSSQEVVDFVEEKLKDPKKRKRPALICEELFDHCLAPNTYGDGTGCDNMTCIIIVLDSFSSTNCNKDGDGETVKEPADDVSSSDDKDKAEQSSELGKHTSERDGGDIKACMAVAPDVNPDREGSPRAEPADTSSPREDKAQASLKRCSDGLDVAEKKRLKVEEHVA